MLTDSDTKFLLADILEELKKQNENLQQSNKIHEAGYEKLAEAILKREGTV